MANRYLDGLPARAKRKRPLLRIVLLWGLLIVFFLAIWQLLQPSDVPAPPRHHGSRAPASMTEPRAELTLPESLGIVLLPMLPLGLGAFLLFIALRARRFASVNTQRAELLLAREQVDDAVTELRRLLVRVQGGHMHWATMLLLGRCAEAKGDFAEAAEIFDFASSSLGGPGMRVLRRQLAPFAAAHRAFALAAVGRLEEADAALAVTSDPIALPPTKARVVRARALLLARRREHRALLDLLAAERMLVRNATAERDRELLRVLGALAQRALAGGTRAPAHRHEVDPVFRPWIERVAPEVTVLWGNA
jgi:hypothetical protein